MQARVLIQPWVDRKVESQKRPPGEIGPSELLLQIQFLDLGHFLFQDVL